MKKTNQLKKVILSGMLGNALEWYDYALYGHFAVIISKLFFPTGNDSVNIIATFGIFAAGFIMRPIGALFFGYIGDEYGRKKALAASILLMAIPTALIGFLPTYEQIGISAAILLTIIRLLQGFSMGGEFSGSIAYIIEFAPKNRRGIAGSTSMISAIFGILLGSLVATFAKDFMSEEAFISWGWRVPFIIGIFIGLIGFYIRYNLEESPVYEKMKSKKKLSKLPIRDIFKKHLKPFTIMAALYMMVTVPFYTFTIYLTTYLVKIANYEISQAFLMNTIIMVTTIFFIPLGGWISDKIGRKKVLLAVTIFALFAFYPLFTMILSNNITQVLISQIAFAMILGLYLGPIPATLVEAFPANVRYSAMSLSYNLTVAIFGGTTPVIATYLINSTGNNSAPAFYLLFAAIISFIALLFFKDNFKKDLSD